MRLVFCFSLFSIVFLACTRKTKSSMEAQWQNVAVEAPVFSADSAYLYVKSQVDFGPRVPNTPAHTACGDYFVSTLNRLGAQVIEQKVEVKNYAGLVLNARNIIASYQPENKERILLFAHWDSRPYADHDPDPSNHRTPIDGANDGASGCGVLLEIARQLQQKQPSVGVDLIFFDAEDWGVPSFETRDSEESGYCLGSKHWSLHPHVENYTARYGILLDMVGAPDATFYKELYSKRYASRLLNRVWSAAQDLGFGAYFLNADGGMIEDDHVPVIGNRNIPCIDIIHQNQSGDTGFGSFWHTLGDTMEVIDKNTLHAVGQTLLHVIYNEK